MRRIVLVLVIGAMMAALLTFSSPAMAQDFGIDDGFLCDNGDGIFVDCNDLFFGDGSFFGFGDGVTLDNSNQAESGTVTITNSVTSG